MPLDPFFPTAGIRQGLEQPDERYCKSLNTGGVKEMDDDDDDDYDDGYDGGDGDSNDDED